ncbi:MAG: serine/threonine protein kinase [Anaerolineae bacterium]|nr:serine/threonine protein kinase [Anaerolineae bacterium]
MDESSKGEYRKRYQITNMLGEGGMAVVYKAFDTVLERDVAIKVIKGREIGAAQVVQIHNRFDREVKTLAKLTHPNIVHIHDYGHAQGTPYLIMEFLSGGTLADRMKRPIPFETAARWLLPIADALRYAHQRGILHRDVKPANILFTEDGQPMLTDFGIAKILGQDAQQSGDAALTRTGMGIGTPEYMAPEQWHGQFSEKTDMYALGIVFYEMVTGRKPYGADTPAAQLIRQMTEPVPLPSRFITDLPASVEFCILRLLEREPANRYETMDAVIVALQDLAGNMTRPVLGHANQTEVKLPLAVTELPVQKKNGHGAAVAQFATDDEANPPETRSGKKSAANRKIVRGVGIALRQVMIIIVSIAVIVAIILVFGIIYITGLFTRQAIQNAGYDNVYREESYRITEEQLNLDIDASVMPYFEDFVDDINADLKSPNSINFLIQRKGKLHTMHVTVDEKEGDMVFKVDTLDDIPLVFIRGLLSSQVNRGIRNVLEENSMEIMDFVITNSEINYVVRPQ